jgi:hypothetical protein
LFGIVLSWFKSFFSGVKENFLTEVKAAKKVAIRSARQEKWLEHKRKRQQLYGPTFIEPPAPTGLAVRQIDMQMYILYLI